MPAHDHDALLVPAASTHGVKYSVYVHIEVRNCACCEGLGGYPSRMATNGYEGTVHLVISGLDDRDHGKSGPLEQVVHLDVNTRDSRAHRPALSLG